jgi:ribonuclease D
MERHEMLDVLRSLADGINPETHEEYDIESPYHNARIVRALFYAIHELESRQREILPEKKMRTVKSSVKIPPLNPSKEKLFQKLRIWRNEAARVAHWPAYSILGNQSLLAIASLTPTTNEELQEIYGLGSVRIGKYGKEIISIVKRYLDGGISKVDSILMPPEKEKVSWYVLNSHKSHGSSTEKQNGSFAEKIDDIPF